MLTAFVARFGAPVIAGTASAALAFALATTPVEVARAVATAGLTPVAWRAVGGEKIPIDGKGWPTWTPTDGLAVVERHPSANVGLKIGGDLIIVDIDGPDGLALFLDRVPTGALPLGPRVQTGKGWHLYYRATGLAQRSLEHGAGKVELFTAASSRWVALPPSVHPSGTSYAWHHAGLPVPDLPRAVLAWLTDAPAVAAPTFGGPGNRHDTLWKALASARGRGATDDEIAEIAAAFNTALDAPRTEAEVAHVVKQVCKYPVGGTVPTKQPQQRPTNALALRRYADIEERALAWGWKGVLPRRTLTTLVGEPGLGKSLVTCDLAARFTRGDAMPGGGVNGFGAPVNVLMLAIEDDPEDTIKPRLRAAGADMARVFDARMKVEGADDVGALPTFPADVPQLYDLVRAHDIRVVIVDPITACLSEEVNAWRDPDVRRALSPLITLARETDALVLGVMHVNKNEAVSALNRVANSKAFTALPRAVWWLGRDPEDEAHPVMVAVKLNLGPRSKSYGFRITGLEDEAPRVTWDPTPGAVTAKDLERKPLSDERPDPRYEAALTLWAHLKEGHPVDSKVLKEAAKARGVSERTLLRVANEFGIVFERTNTVPTRTTWHWPPLVADPI